MKYTLASTKCLTKYWLKRISNYKLLKTSSQGRLRNVDNFGISSWVSNAVTLEINETIRQFIQETVTLFLEEQRNDTVLDLLLHEILLEIGLVDRCREEHIILDIIGEMLDMELLILVQNFLYDLSTETNLMVFTRSRSCPKSKKVDLIMDNILNMLIFRQILEIKTNDQISGVENRMSQILDSILAKCIIHELSK